MWAHILFIMAALTTTLVGRVPKELFRPITIFVVISLMALMFGAFNLNGLDFHVLGLVLGVIAGIIIQGLRHIYNQQNELQSDDKRHDVLNNYFRFLALSFGLLVVLQIAAPHMARLLNNATNVEIAGLVRLQIAAPIGPSSRSTETTYFAPASTFAEPQSRRVQTALNAVSLIASSAKELDETASESCLQNCSDSTREWNAARRIVLASAGISTPDSSSASPVPYSQLPMIFRDFTQIAFIASPDEEEFLRIVRVSLLDDLSQIEQTQWTGALRQNFTIFKRLSGMLACVRSYSSIVRDLRLHLLDSHELVRAVGLLASNPMHLPSRGIPLRQSSLNRNSLSLGAETDGSFSDVRLEGIQVIADKANQSAGSIEELTSRAKLLLVNYPGQRVSSVATQKLLQESRYLVTLAGAAGLDGGRLNLSLDTAETVLRRDGVQDTLELVAALEGLNEEAYNLNTAIRDLATQPWRRAIIRIDKALETVFERSASELTIYGQGGYRENELWAIGSGPRPTDRLTGETCSFSSFDQYRNGLIAALSGANVNDGRDNADQSLPRMRSTAEALTFTPYATIAAAYLFAGIGGTDSAISLLSRWIDQVPDGYWSVASSSAVPQTSMRASQSADTWFRIRAFATLHTLPEIDATTKTAPFRNLLQSTVQSIARQRPDIRAWYSRGVCGRETRSELYKQVLQFFHYYYMTLRYEELRYQDPLNEISDTDVEEFRMYINVPDACFSTVEQFRTQSEGWRGKFGLALAERLARRGLSRRWSGVQAGLDHPDVKSARTILLEAEANLTRQADRLEKAIWTRSRSFAPTANEIGPWVLPGPIETMLLDSQNEWVDHRSNVRRLLEILQAGDQVH